MWSQPGKCEEFKEIQYTVYSPWNWPTQSKYTFWDTKHQIYYNLTRDILLLEFSHVTSSLIDVGQRPQVGRVSLPLILELPDGIFHLGDAYGGCGTFSFSLDHFFSSYKKNTSKTWCPKIPDNCDFNCEIKQQSLKIIRNRCKQLYLNQIFKN